MASAPPGLGSFENLRLARRLLADPRAPIEEYTRRFGPIWQSLIPGNGLRLVPLVWLMGQAGNERVLSPKYKDDFTWYEGYRFTMEPLFGRQILFLLDDEGEPGAHKQRQRLLIPAFHPRLDPDYTAAMTRIIDEELDALPLAEPIDVQALSKRLTFAIAAQLLLGARPADLPMLRRHFEELGLGLYSVVHLPIPGLPFHRARRARAALQAYLTQKLAACRRGDGAAPPMLHSLLHESAAAEQPISDDSIIAELIAFLYAGYDTTSSLLTSIVAALAQHPAVLRRLRDEIAVESGGDCAYLEAVLLEGERLFPPLLFALRGVRRDIEFGGYHIKAGSKVTYSPYFTGRMPELFPDPQIFRPERFLDEDGALRRPAPYTVLGFGGGHRMCIGKRFAGLEMRLFLVRLLRRFALRFLPQADETLYFNPALFRRHGYLAELHAAQPSR
jgi:cytochrome P450